MNARLLPLYLKNQNVIIYSARPNRINQIIMALFILLQINNGIFFVKMSMSTFSQIFIAFVCGMANLRNFSMLLAAITVG